MIHSKTLLNDLDNSLISTPKIFLIVGNGEKSKEVIGRIINKIN
jgi:hypothetical protein